MTQNLLLARSAHETVEALVSNQITLSQLNAALEAHRDRTNPDINAFDSFNTTHDPQHSGRLAGLPITVKDQIAVAGLSLNFGLDKAVQSPSSTTAPIVQRFLDAGAVVSGKTTLPPYAMDFQTSNRRVGHTNNPWDISRTCGGSSGGGAAAVASGMSFLDIGADLGGSLRLPAAYCGVCSLLPGEGAVPTGGMLAKGRSLAHFARPGPIARNVEDLELAWEIITSGRRGASETKTPRIAAWNFEGGTNPVAPEITQVFETTYDRLSKKGLSLSKSLLPSLFRQESYECYGQIMGYETGSLMPFFIRWLARVTGRASASRSPNFLHHVHQGYRCTRKHYIRALDRRAELQRNFQSALAGYDAALIPVCGVQPFPHRTPDSDRNGIRDYSAPFMINGTEIGYLDALTMFTVPITLMGNPVVTIPLGLDANGLPVGGQLIGKPGDEWALLGIARKLMSVVQMPTCPPLRSA